MSCLSLRSPIKQEDFYVLRWIERNCQIKKISDLYEWIANKGRLALYSTRIFRQESLPGFTFDFTVSFAEMVTDCYP
jgi:hypothetical protein